MSKILIKGIVSDLIAVFPVRGWIEEMALSELNNRIDKLTEEQCSTAVRLIQKRLILTSLAH